jgi:exonuclease III
LSSDPDIQVVIEANDPPAAQQTSMAPWSLRVASLNCKGLTDPLKRRRVFAELRALKPDVVCIQETHITEVEVPDWSFLWAPHLPHLTHWRHPDDESRSAGVALLFNKSRFNTADIASVPVDHHNGRVVCCLVKAAPNVVIRCTGVYAPNDGPGRQRFFNSISHELDISSGNHNYDVLLGDFNCVDDPVLDRVRGVANPSSLVGSVELSSLASSLDTADLFRQLHPSDRNITWRNTTLGSRLDRIFVDRSLLGFTAFQQRSSRHSDHDVLVASIDAPLVRRGKSWWKLNTSVLHHDEYQQLITESINEAKQRTDLTVHDRWDHIKQSIKTASIAYCTQLATKRKRDTNEAHRDHQRALDAWTEDANDLTITALRAATNHLEQLERAAFDAAATRARATWLLQGERCTRYFCSLEKRRQQENVIVTVTDSSTGTTVNKPKEMTNAGRSFYASLYTPENDIDEVAVQDLLQHTPKITDAQRAQLDRPINLDDIKGAIDRSPNNKCPGLDGLPVEFYRTFFPTLGPYLLDMYVESLRVGHLPASCRQGALCLLYKKGNRDDLRNYRPLTMLTADYKILSKIMADRLDTVLHHLIHPNQSGFIRNRQITDNLALLHYTRKFLRRIRGKGIVIFTDQEKAFDRVHWRYRDMVLTHCSFGPFFIAVVQLLHTHISAIVQINGHMSTPFDILRGTRQGDPLSPGLFVLLEEPFACALRADEQYTGITLPDGTRRLSKIGQYADDKAFYAATNADVRRLNFHIDRYERASGARINVAKSAALLLGIATATDFPSCRFPILQNGQSIKYLGSLVGPTLSDEQLWQPVMD